MKNNLKAPLSERICNALDIPCEALPQKSYVEIHGRSSIKIVGGGSIMLYSPKEIRIALKKGEHLQIRGYALHCSSYNMGSVGIEGRILSLSFEDSDDEI